MRIEVFLGLVLRVALSTAETMDCGFHGLVCQQCTASCSGEMKQKPTQKVIRGPVGPAGPMGRRGFTGPQGEKGEPGPPGEVNMTKIEQLIERKIKEVLSTKQTTTAMPSTTRQETTESVTTQHAPYSSCRGVNLASAKSRNETGGVFEIEIPGVGTEEVYCNTEVDGGGWTVFQRRMDGSVDFYLDWADYVSGFGNATGEYWLGLEAIHQLTKNGKAEMRIDMIQDNGTYYYAKYSHFKLEPASDRYRLRVDCYQGNITDALIYKGVGDERWYHNNQPFATKDKADSASCTRLYKGAWWYNACYMSNLNGLYRPGSVGEGVVWELPDGEFLTMKFTEMKLRQKN